MNVILSGFQEQYWFLAVGFSMFLELFCSLHASLSYKINLGLFDFFLMGNYNIPEKKNLKLEYILHSTKILKRTQDLSKSFNTVNIFLFSLIVWQNVCNTEQRLTNHLKLGMSRESNKYLPRKMTSLSSNINILFFRNLISTVTVVCVYRYMYT